MKSKFLIMVSLAALGFASCAQEPVQKEIGLQLYSIRDQIGEDLETSLDAVAEAGYTFVEMAGYNAQEGTFYGLSGAAFKELCNEKELDVISSHINGPDPNAATWEECMAWWDKAIQDHLETGVSYIVQPSMWRSAYESVEGLARYCELFNAVGEKCNNAGIRFGYHNHAHEFTTVFDEVVMYDFMLQNTDPEKMFFQIDVFWSQVGGAPAVDYLDKYPGRFELWHVKDDKEIGASGKIDFKAIYERASISGLKYAIVEQEAFDMLPFESIKASYDFLNKAPYVNNSYSD
ncbi:MAG: TIM barrel protein [Bacteroidales bacterium]|jgi:sugar phosphate isomerase/epimerase|nr:TIM barrel protein [Bacteroidales bacterium]MDD2824122.1 TIM barrel protein [Bacteroidales bacterium]MDD3100097.1 TIM barrel protein [Bacteroidales bacterium]MDD3639003.1 TIM barrel protein [Bacteroidales bacterium]MDD3943568.1 TIM barrel protein [Bacteroidales bacterium]